MYDVVPDLLKAYYVSITVAILVGAALGVSVYRAIQGYCKASKQVDEMLHTTQGAAYDACLDDEPETDHDAQVWSVLYQAKR